MAWLLGLISKQVTHLEKKNQSILNCKVRHLAKAYRSTGIRRGKISEIHFFICGKKFLRLSHSKWCLRYQPYLHSSHFFSWTKYVKLLVPSQFQLCFTMVFWVISFQKQQSFLCIVSLDSEQVFYLVITDEYGISDHREHSTFSNNRFW